jgi:hypothetical protein
VTLASTHCHARWLFTAPQSGKTFLASEVGKRRGGISYEQLDLDSSKRMKIVFLKRFSLGAEAGQLKSRKARKSIRGKGK